MKTPSTGSSLAALTLAAGSLIGCDEGRVGDEIFIAGKPINHFDEATGEIIEIPDPKAAEINAMLAQARKDFDACPGRDVTDCHEKAIKERDAALAKANIKPKTETWFLAKTDLAGSKVVSYVRAEVCKSIPGCTIVDAKK